MSGDDPNHGKVTDMTATAAAPLPTNETDLLDELEGLQAIIDAADAARDRRVALWLQARRLDPRITYARLAAASSVAEPYVIKIVKQNTPAQEKRRR